MDEASNSFSFNAPTYFDFHQQSENESAEIYFETDHENSFNNDPTLPVRMLQQDSECVNDTSIISLSSAENSRIQTPDPLDIREPIKFRRSLSTGDLLPLLKSQKQSQEKAAVAKQNRLTRLAQPKNAAQPKYVSTAEQMTKFYGTPDRFHTRHKKFEVPRSKQFKEVTSTIPQSPCLTTKYRQRTTYILSTEEMEKLQIEEHKKFKIKANPINYKALQGPVKPVAPQKKPCTQVKPFNLTENPSKQVESQEEQYEFHARPVPKAIYGKSNPAVKPVQTKTQMLRTGSVENLRIKPVKPVSAQKPFRATATEPAPFSFAARDQQIAKRREKLVTKILEEEKKAREFKANPPPKYVFKKCSSLNSLKSNEKHEEEKNNVAPVFKAKSPVVLYQKPFEPKKSERVLTEVTEFSLNTDRRLKEREEFEKKLKEKHEYVKEILQQRELEKIRQEEAEIAKLRKETVHVAQPVRRYKELIIESTMKVTIPQSPNLKTSKRLHAHNKEN